MEDYIKIEKVAKRKADTRKIIIYLLLVLWAIMVLFPFYWMILTSIKSYGAYSSEYIPKFFTLSPTIENYIKVFTSIDISKYLLNTLIYTISTTILMLITCILAAYGFSKLQFKGRDLTFTVFLALMMIPNELVVITNFVTITEMNLRNTFLGLILPTVTSVFYIYLLKENFSAVSDNLYYAAKVDGTSDLKFLLKVLVPICKPTIITVTILKVIECWNNYVWPRLITDKSDLFLVSNGIQQIRENGMGRDNIPAMMAAVVIISIPLIILFLLFHKKIMEGVSRGGNKG